MAAIDGLWLSTYTDTLKFLEILCVDGLHPFPLLGQTTILYSQTWSCSFVMLANVHFSKMPIQVFPDEGQLSIIFTLFPHLLGQGTSGRLCGCLIRLGFP